MSKVVIGSVRTLKSDISAHVLGRSHTAKVNAIAQKALSKRLEGRLNSIVTSSVKSALGNLRQIYSEGVGSAEAPMHSLTYRIAGADWNEWHTLRVRWPALSEKYLESKQDFPGEGSFMLFEGDLGSAIFGVGVPPVESDVHVDKVTPVQGRKRLKEITFRASVSVGKMRFPLDDLVRRPLILGKKAPQPAWPHGKLKMPLREMVYLEGGTTRAPARPFIRSMSLRIHDSMRSEIYSVN